MNRRILIGLILLAGLGGAAAYGLVRARHHDGSTLAISGNIEVIEAQMSFKIPGRVEQRPVDEGYVVSPGDLIAQLDTADLECDVGQRRGDLAAAKAALAALEAGSRPDEIAAAEAAMNRLGAALAELKAGSRPEEIEIARATLASAEADRIRLEKEYKRADELFSRNALAQEDHDRAKAAWDVAVAKAEDARQHLSLAIQGPRKEEIDQAQAAYNQSQSQYRLTKEGPRREDIDQGRAKVKQAEAALKLAEVKLGYATLRSPMPGVVLSKNIEPGEYVSPGTPVVTIANLRDIWLRGYVNYTDLDRVHVGQRALVTTSAFPGRQFEGRVSFISQQAEFTPKTVQTEQERVKLVYRIKVDIQNPKLELKPGMPADAELMAD